MAAATTTHYQDLPIAVDASPRRKIAHLHFDVSAQPAYLQLLAWRERMGQVIDVVPSLSELERPFRGFIDRYDVGEFLFADCYTDRITLARTIAQISRDNARSIVFHVFLEAAPSSLLTRPAKREGAALDGGILAVDLDQPVRLLRGGCRHSRYFCRAKGCVTCSLIPALCTGACSLHACRRWVMSSGVSCRSPLASGS